MKPATHHLWNRLVAAARQILAAEQSAPIAAPAGFSARIVALANIQIIPASLSAILFERLALRSLGCALALTLLSAVWSFSASAIHPPSTDDQTWELIDPVGEVILLTQSS